MCQRRAVWSAPRGAFRVLQHGPSTRQELCYDRASKGAAPALLAKSLVLQTALLTLALSPSLKPPGGLISATFKPRDTVGQLLDQARGRLKDGEYRLAFGLVAGALSAEQKDWRDNKNQTALMELAGEFADAGFWEEAVYCNVHLLQMGTLTPAARSDAEFALAELHLKLDQPAKSVAAYERALVLAQASGERAAQRRALTGLAGAYAAGGDMGKAKAYFEQERNFEGADRDDGTEARSLGLLAALQREQGKLEEARRTLEWSLEIYRRLGDRDDEVMTIVSLSAVHLASGDEASALGLGETAVKLAAGAANLDLRWRSWLALARVQRALGDDRNALASYFRAFGFVEAQNVLLTSDELKISLIEERQSVYRELADLYASTGRTDEAFKVAEHARARATLDLLTGSRMERRQDRPGRDAQITLLKRFVQPVGPVELSESVLRPGEVLIEFLLGENRSHVWLLTHQGARCMVLPPRRVIEYHVKSYLQLISNKPSALHLERDLARQRKGASELFNLLLGGATELSAARSFIIAPDGLLYYLPFESLVSEGRYLIEDHEISYVPSASVLKFLRQTLVARDSDARKELIAFGDPVMRSVRGRQTRARPRLSFSVVGPGAVESLAPLPNTRIEITSIAKVFPHDQSELHLGSSATESLMKRVSLGQFRRLHVASHALADESHPARSGVVLSAGDDPQEDGFLNLDEIAGLDLDCDLVVLSACRSGRGQLLKGEGIVGLTRAFLYAGARAVSVSLWSVSDLSTTALMTAFYRTMAGGGSEAGALRQAKIEIIRGGRASRHPYYWAAFVLVGDPV